MTKCGLVAVKRYINLVKAKVRSCYPTIYTDYIEEVLDMTFKALESEAEESGNIQAPTASEYLESKL